MTYIATFFSHFGAVKVNLTVGKLDDGIFPFIVVPQNDSDAQRQFFRKEGFDHVIVRAKAQALQPVLVLPAGSQKEYGNFRKRSDLLKQGKTISVRQHHI